MRASLHRVLIYETLRSSFSQHARIDCPLIIFRSLYSTSFSLHCCPDSTTSMIFVSRNPFFGRILQFQWFLIVLSVRPGMNFDIRDHRLPQAFTPRASSHSSSSLHSSFLTPSRRWLCQRSLHCLPPRLQKCQAIELQSLAPYSLTNSLSRSSSSLFQAFFAANFSMDFMSQSFCLMTWVEESLCLCEVPASSAFFGVRKWCSREEAAWFCRVGRGRESK